MGRRVEVYIKPTRFNLTLTFEQYKFLLKRKEHAKKYNAPWYQAV